MVDAYKRETETTDCLPVLLLARKAALQADGWPILVDENGYLLIGAGTKSSATTNTSITVGSVSTLVLSANTSRLYAVVSNDSTETMYVSLSDTAIMNTGHRLNAHGGAWVIYGYTGQISAICSSGGKNICGVEV